jgi:Protein of unknown function (DUF3341)
MTNQTIQGVFQREEDLIRAAETSKDTGWRIVDIYTPYPMHETAHLLGLRRSRLPRAAFVFGFLGVALAFWFQFWVSAFDWPLNVGGRPWNSLPAFVPVAFELMVLFAGLGVVLTFLVVCRLYPGKKADLSSPAVTDDCFVLEVQGPGTEASLETIRRLFRECHAKDLRETERP